MDKNSDRYRVCPNDGEEFMAKHRSEKFCCRQCANEFHNQKKRFEAEQLQKEEIVQTRELNDIRELDSTIVTSPLVGNINLIGATLGNRFLRKVSKDSLTEKGFAYDVYEYKYQIPGTELNLLTYGPYAIAWGYENHILVTFKKNIPWIQ